MHDETGRAKKAGDRGTRADGVLIHNELIVVPADARADSPIAFMDKILDVSALLQVWAAAFGWEISGEGERKRSARVEGIVGIVGIAGDDVVEVFVQEEIVGLDTSFEFVNTVMD